MSTSVYFVKRQELVTRQIAGETVIIRVMGGVGDLNSIYTLNQPGTFIWELLNKGTKVGEIARALCREYDVTQEVAEKDIAEFLGSLETEGLVYSSQENGG